MPKVHNVYNVIKYFKCIKYNSLAKQHIKYSNSTAYLFLGLRILLQFVDVVVCLKFGRHRGNAFT